MGERDLILSASALLSPPRALRGAAVLVREGRIAALGGVEELVRAHPRAERLELGRATLLPGLVDSHTHFFEWARRLAGLDLSGVRDTAALRERLDEHRARLGAGDEWVGGSGWDPGFLHTEPRLDRSLLDEFFPDRPVSLESRDFHTLWCNTAALERAGILEGRPAPTGGEIGRRADGSPDGLLYETAWELILDARPVESEPTRCAWLREAFSRAHTMGLTGFHSMEPMEAYRSYELLSERGELPMRVVFHSPLTQLAERLSQPRPSYRSHNAFLRWGGVKIFMDGSLGSRSAYMLDPYPDGGRGRLLMPVQELAEHILRAARGGIAPSIHAIGDACVRSVVDALESVRKTLAEEGRSLPPGTRVEHAQCVRPEEIPRLAGLGALCAMQAIHLADDIPLLPELWPSAAEYAYPMRSLLDGGVRIALGSDLPVADPDPRAGIYAAISRREGNRPDGRPWHPEQALAPLEALAGYTSWAARAGRWEEEAGFLAVGMPADLVALELPDLRAPEQEWEELPLRLTLVDGRIVYEDLP